MAPLLLLRQMLQRLTSTWVLNQNLLTEILSLPYHSQLLLRKLLKRLNFLLWLVIISIVIFLLWANKLKIVVGCSLLLVLQVSILVQEISVYLVVPFIIENFYLPYKFSWLASWLPMMCYWFEIDDIFVFSNKRSKIDMSESGMSTLSYSP